MAEPESTVSRSAIGPSFPPPGFRHVVMQPTSLCNLDCRYCYLPDRKIASFMAPSIAEAVAEEVRRINAPITIIWHGGEPLSAGVSRFTALLEPFRELTMSGLVTHGLQTNATLLNSSWCAVLKEHQFSVGVSIDGDEQSNVLRVTLNGSPTFRKTVRGIELLRQNHIPFSIIAVINHANYRNAARIYDFALSTGCTQLNVNIEELEGLNAHATPLSRDSVRRFWSELFDSWRQRPLIRVREFDRALKWLRSGGSVPSPEQRDFFPTISTSGDVVVISPEFISVPADQRGQFIVGNVLEQPLTQIIKDAAHAPYVREFIVGAQHCQESCEYFDYCGGGMPSNKYFEHGRLDVTETEQCINTRQVVIDTVVNFLVTTQPTGGTGHDH